MNGLLAALFFFSNILFNVAILEISVCLYVFVAELMFIFKTCQWECGKAHVPFCV